MREKVNAVPVTCDYGHEVQGHLHCNLSLSPVKGQPRKTIAHKGFLYREMTLGRLG